MVDQLQKIVAKAAKALYDNEKFVIGALAVRANRIAQAFPTDQTTVHMANFLSKRAANNDFISRSELKDVYNRLYTSNNKFAEHFSDELGATEMPKATVMQRDPMEGTDLVQSAYEKLADPILANALESAFDKTIPYKPFTATAANDAKSVCVRGLASCGASPKKIDVVAGQSDLFLCQATYDTPKGESHVLIPVEVKNSRALFPTVFLSTAGFMNLESKAIQEHLVKIAGKNYNVDVNKVLALISTAKNGVAEPLSDVEQIVMRANAFAETPVSHTVNAVLMQQVDEPVSLLEEPQYEQPAEVQAFAQSLTSAAGAAEFTLGKGAVDMGRKMIRQALTSWGYKNPQVAVANNDMNTIFYAVAVDNKAGFTVPVEVVKGKAQSPEMIVSSAGLVEFTNSGVSQILSDGEPNIQVMAMASPMYNRKPSELVADVRDAMMEKNYIKAEEALTVLRTTGDDKAYKVGFEIYSAGLAGSLEEKKESSCSMQMKTAHSKYVICGHTNLPLHRVYQDKNGDCRPGYRQGMSESAEGGSFLNSKIYFG